MLIFVVLNLLLRKYWNSIDRERVSKVGFHAFVNWMKLAVKHQYENPHSGKIKAMLTRNFGGKSVLKV